MRLWLDRNIGGQLGTGVPWFVAEPQWVIRP